MSSPHPLSRLKWLPLAILALLGCSHDRQPASEQDAGPPPPMTFQQVSDAALQTLQTVFYDDGNWQLCVPAPCGIIHSDDFDWGADSLTGALFLRWSLANDASIPPMMTQLDANGPTYGTCTATNCPSWSDVPLWDSIAASHEHLVLGTANTLKRAQEAFDYVDTAAEFGLGACPSIDYQVPANNSDPLTGGPTVLKTLETDSNYVKAALLLFQITNTATYLTKAQAKYASIRQYFLDPTVPLYTVYVLDDGTSCTQVPRHFYASVNGNMIWSGMALAAATGTGSYLDDAIATAQAVAMNLSDASGVFADLQTDDDVVEPLIEAMYLMATQQGQSFASTWLQANAQAMASDLASDGAYGRFFDGPAPQDEITVWEANGGFALAFVAGALWPDQLGNAAATAWQDAVYVPDDLSSLPCSIEFTGQAIAVFGTLGETSYQLGEATVLVDGVQTFDQTGIHQNQSNAFGPVANAVLFAWRWPSSGPHTLEFQAGPSDPKDGGPFLHVQGYSYVP
jgi:hypothetical protein